jgi:hypothetical protein
LDQSASGRGRSDRACLGVTNAVPAAHRAHNSIRTSSSRPSPDPDGTDWRRRISPGQATTITDFLSGTHRLRRKGPFSGPGSSGRFRLNRIAISKNLIRLCATGSRSPARAHHKGVSGVRWIRPVLPAYGARPALRCGSRRIRRRCLWFEGRANATEPSSGTPVVMPSIHIMPQASLSPPPAQRRRGFSRVDRTQLRIGSGPEWHFYK